MDMKDKLKMLYGNELEIIEGDEVADFAYFDNSKLKMIYLNSDIKRIGHGAFFGCSTLKVVFLKDKEYKIDTTEGLDKFIEVFESEQGEIGVGAFETSSSSILIRECSDNKEKLHDEFVKELSPEPFCNNKYEKLFMKIVEGDDKGMFYISLLNSKMLAYDRYYFMLDNNDKEGYYYRPYFYEFIIKDNGNFFNKFDQNFIGEWMIGQLREPEEISDNEYALIGDVIFSASPMEFKKRKLEIIDKSVPDIVKNVVKKTYELSHANKVNEDNKVEILYPIINNIIKDTTPESVKVYKVGQANCNYIYFDNKKRIMFDVGYSYIKEDSDKSKISKRQPPSRCKPDLVILSHWDLDHILGVVLCEPEIFDINWIAPDMENLPKNQYSVSASRLAKYLCWKNKLLLIDEDLNSKDIFYSESFQIWKGAGNKDERKCCRIVYRNETKKLSKANNFGLIVILNKNDNNVLLSGDCEYQMHPCEIYNSNIRYKYMIVPHHGSKMKLICPKQKNKNNGEDYAFISFGYNYYGHYDAEHKAFLEDMGYNVKTTKESDKGYKIDLNLGEVKDL